MMKQILLILAFSFIQISAFSSEAHSRSDVPYCGRSDATSNTMKEIVKECAMKEDPRACLEFEGFECKIAVGDPEKTVSCMCTLSNGRLIKVGGFTTRQVTVRQDNIDE